MTGYVGQIRSPAVVRDSKEDVRQEVGVPWYRPKEFEKEEGESNFQSKFTGQGKTVTQVFNDKYLQTLKEMVGGVEENGLTKNWVDREQDYNILMCIMGQKLLATRGGGATVSQVTPSQVEGECVCEGIRGPSMVRLIRRSVTLVSMLSLTSDVYWSRK
jgi:hypothetical protein